MSTMDPIVLQALWARLVAITNEVGTAMARTAFSPVVREGLDYSVTVTDASGNVIAQGNSAAAGHAGSMPVVAKTLLREITPEAMRPGDIFATNDPWIGAGQTNDLYVVKPIFQNGRMIGLCIASEHMLDVGGRVASPEAREIYEEGLRIPVVRLFQNDEPNADIFAVIRDNVRLSHRVIADIQAQKAAVNRGGERVVRALDEYGMLGLETLSAEIVGRTDAAMRAAILELPDGVYRASTQTEHTAPDGSFLRIEVMVGVDGDQMVIDYAGTSPQIELPINAVLNYTRTYSVLGIKDILEPDLPNNEGTYRSIAVTAPEGSILNCTFPVAVHFRQINGLLLPELLFRALADAVPTKIHAQSGGAPTWPWTLTGVRASGERYLVNTNFFGGLGARHDEDGMSAVSFPANARDIPVEVIEQEAPILVERREYYTDSGGPGRFRGGLGEEMSIRNISGAIERVPAKMVVSVVSARRRNPALGLSGGHAGPLGSLHVDGKPSTNTGGEEVLLPDGSQVTVRVPGGGGYGNPRDRDPEAVLQDVRNEVVSREQAETVYGVVPAREDAA
jgi:N-methylhydantoinase B